MKMVNKTSNPYSDLDWLDDHPCTACDDCGVEGGCPECGIWPDKKKERVVDNVLYRFITNTPIGSKTHEDYKELQRTGLARVLIEELTTDRYNKPVPEYVGLWAAEDDIPIIIKLKIFPYLL
jgi:hypothetical protein